MPSVLFRGEIVVFEPLEPTRSATSGKFGSEEVPLDETAAILEPGVVLGATPPVSVALAVDVVEIPATESHKSFWAPCLKP